MSSVDLFGDMSYIPRGKDEITHEFLVQVGKRKMFETINAIDGLECLPEHLLSEQQVEGNKRGKARSDFSAITDIYMALGEAKASAADARSDHAKQEIIGYIECLLAAEQVYKFLFLSAAFEFSHVLYNTYESALETFPQSEQSRFKAEVIVVEVSEITGREVIPPYCRAGKADAEDVFAPKREGVPDFKNYSIGRVTGVRKTLPISSLMYDETNKRIFGSGKNLTQEECEHRLHSEKYINARDVKKVYNRRREMVYAGQIKEPLVVYEQKENPGLYTVIDGNSRLFYARAISSMASYAPGYVELPVFIVDPECVELAEQCKYEEQNSTVLPHSKVMDALACVALYEKGYSYREISDQLSVNGGEDVAHGSIDTVKWLEKHYHTPREFDHMDQVYDVAYECAFNIKNTNMTSIASGTSIKGFTKANVRNKIFEHCRNNASDGWLDKNNFSMIAKIINTANRPVWKQGAFDHWYKRDKGWDTPASFKASYEEAEAAAKEALKKGSEYYKDQLRKSNKLVERVVEMLDSSLELRKNGTEESAPYGCKDGDLQHLVNQLSRMSKKLERDYDRLCEQADDIGLEW